MMNHPGPGLPRNQGKVRRRGRGDGSGRGRGRDIRKGNRRLGGLELFNEERDEERVCYIKER